MLFYLFFGNNQVAQNSWECTVYDPDQEHGGQYRQLGGRNCCKDKESYTAFDADVGQKEWRDNGDAEEIGWNQGGDP